MKYLIVSDTHFGISSFNKKRFEYMIAYFENEVFPFILENKIKHVIHLGDLVDKRNVIDFYIDNGVKNRFIDWFEQNKVHLYLIVGNHDMYYKNERSINYCSINFKGRFKYVHVIDEIMKKKIGKLNFLFVPWIVNEIELEMIKDSDADICCGHFEISGVKIGEKVYLTQGLNQSVFKNFKLTLSGHIHTIQKLGKNILYVGTPYQLMWADYNQEKGVWLLKDDLSIELIENKISPKFVKIFCYENYFEIENERFERIDEIKEVIENNFFKFIILEKRKDLDEIYEFLSENAQFKYEIITESEVKAYQILNGEIDVKVKSINEIIEESLEAMQIESDRKEFIVREFNEIITNVEKGSMNEV